MTEADWLAYQDPAPMLRLARGAISDRKLRLFIVGCCRRFQRDWPTPPEYDGILEWAELYADGRADAGDLASVAAEVAGYVEDYAPPWWTGIAAAIACALRLPHPDPDGLRAATLQVLEYGRSERGDPAARAGEAFARQAALLRDVAGPLPFRRVRADLAGLAPGTVTLARAIYDERRWELLPRLADLLEESGCPAEVARHCRSGGPHVRGCWVVDLVLGKEKL